MLSKCQIYRLSKFLKPYRCVYQKFLCVLVNTVSPMISYGDGIFTASNGTRTCNPSFTYQWQMIVDDEFEDIVWATSNSYTPLESGEYRIVVTARKFGNTLVIQSNVIDFCLLEVIEEPFITEDDDTLVIDNGDWTCEPSFSYQWQEKVGANFEDIVGETDSEFTPTDAGEYRAIVIGWNESQSITVTTNSIIV